jgi:uncharacterized membrane protein
MALNLVVTAAFAANFAWRLGGDGGRASWGQLVLSVVSLAGLAVSGALGGRLAYHYGVRVADEQTQLTGFRPSHAPERGHAAAPITPEER